MHLLPEKGAKNLWGYSTLSLIGGGHNLVTSMREDLDKTIFVEKFVEIYQIFTKLLPYVPTGPLGEKNVKVLGNVIYSFYI